MEVGMVFGLVFAVIVMGAIFLFGTGTFEKMICAGDVAQTTKALKDLETVVDKVQVLDEGSRQTFRMRLPVNSKICFVDPDDPEPNLIGDWYPKSDALIEEEIQSSRYNVWIDYSCGEGDRGYRMKYLITAEPGKPGNFCAESGDTVLLINRGIEVSVEKYTG